MRRRSSSTACSRARRGRTSSFATRTAYARRGTPDWVSGACILVRRDALESSTASTRSSSCTARTSISAGGCGRPGYELVFEPAARVVHVGGASAPRASLLPALAASRVRYARSTAAGLVAFLERVGVALGAVTHALVGRGGTAARAGHARRCSPLRAAASQLAIRLGPSRRSSRSDVVAAQRRLAWDEPCAESAESFRCGGEPRAVVAPDVLDRMTDAMTHRGPNDRGTYQRRRRRARRPPAQHRRRRGRPPAVRERGRQRLGDPERRALQPRRDPRRLGAARPPFASRCDTEILPHLYEEHGAALPEQLRGKFGAAPSGTGASGGPWSRATGSASSRSTTPRSATCSSSRPS